MPFFSKLALTKGIEKWGIVLYVIALCTSMSGMELFSILLILWVSIDSLKGLKEGGFSSRLNRLPPYTIPLLILVVGIWLGIFLGDAQPKEKWYDAQRVRFFFIYFFLYSVLQKQLWEGKWFRAMLLVSVFVAIYGTVQHFIPLDLFRPEGKKIFLYAIQDEKIGPLVIGTFNHHLTFSNVYLLHACVISAVGLSLWPKRKSIFLLGLWLYLLCIWTDSRAAWVAIPFTIFTIGWIKGPKLMLGGTVVALIVLTAFYFTDRGFNERFRRTLLQPTDLYSLGPRTRLWKAQFQMFKEHPILGVGFNNNERKAKEYVDRLYPDRPDNFYGHAHSNLLQLLASTGIVGSLLFLFLWWCIFRDLVRYIAWNSDTLNRGLAVGVLAAFIGFHIQGITQWNFGDAEVLHNLMFYWAVAAALSSSKNDGSKKFLAI